MAWTWGGWATGVRNGRTGWVGNFCVCLALEDPARRNNNFTTTTGNAMHQHIHAANTAPPGPLLRSAPTLYTSLLITLFITPTRSNSPHRQCPAVISPLFPMKPMPPPPKKNKHLPSSPLPPPRHLPPPLLPLPMSPHIPHLAPPPPPAPSPTSASLPSKAVETCSHLRGKLDRSGDGSISWGGPCRRQKHASLL